MVLKEGESKRRKNKEGNKKREEERSQRESLIQTVEVNIFIKK